MRNISPKEIIGNPFAMIGDQWMLITAGDGEKCNTMTASWGGLGVLWNAPVATCYVRPQRYTKEFVDREELYTLCFFDGYKKELAYLGSHSGRDEDKVAKTGLTPVFGQGFTYFAEAKLVLVCRKLYRAPLKEEGFFFRETVEKNYPDRDFHDLYIGQIVKVLVADE